MTIILYLELLGVCKYQRIGYPNFKRFKLNNYEPPRYKHKKSLIKCYFNALS